MAGLKGDINADISTTKHKKNKEQHKYENDMGLYKSWRSLQFLRKFQHLCRNTPLKGGKKKS